MSSKNEFSQEEIEQEMEIYGVTEEQALNQLRANRSTSRHSSNSASSRTSSAYNRTPSETRSSNSLFFQATPTPAYTPSETRSNPLFFQATPTPAYTPSETRSNPLFFQATPTPARTNNRMVPLTFPGAYTAAPLQPSSNNRSQPLTFPGAYTAAPLQPSSNNRNEPLTFLGASTTAPTETQSEPSSVPTTAPTERQSEPSSVPTSAPIESRREPSSVPTSARSETRSNSLSFKPTSSARSNQVVQTSSVRKVSKNEFSSDDINEHAAIFGLTYQEALDDLTKNTESSSAAAVPVPVPVEPRPGQGSTAIPVETRPSPFQTALAQSSTANPSVSRRTPSNVQRALAQTSSANPSRNIYQFSQARSNAPSIDPIRHDQLLPFRSTAASSASASAQGPVQFTERRIHDTTMRETLIGKIHLPFYSGPRTCLVLLFVFDGPRSRGRLREVVIFIPGEGLPREIELDNIIRNIFTLLVQFDLLPNEKEIVVSVDWPNQGYRTYSTLHKDSMPIVQQKPAVTEFLRVNVVQSRSSDYTFIQYAEPGEVTTGVSVDVSGHREYHRWISESPGDGVLIQNRDLTHESPYAMRQPGFEVGDAVLSRVAPETDDFFSTLQENRRLSRYQFIGFDRANDEFVRDQPVGRFSSASSNYRRVASLFDEITQNFSNGNDYVLLTETGPPGFIAVLNSIRAKPIPDQPLGEYQRSTSSSRAGGTKKKYKKKQNTKHTKNKNHNKNKNTRKTNTYKK
jgi:hypothetical protein